MIITRIDKLENYINLNEDFKTVIENTARFSSPDMENGKYKITERVFAVVNSYESAEAKKDFFENHRKYIDIQCVLAGSEEIYTADAQRLTIDREYDAENDYELYKTPKEFSALVLSAGDCAVFFPGEAHLPGVMKKSGAEKISKLIFKVRV